MSCFVFSNLSRSRGTSVRVFGLLNGRVFSRQPNRQVLLRYNCTCQPLVSFFLLGNLSIDVGIVCPF